MYKTWESVEQYAQECRSLDQDHWNTDGGSWAGGDMAEVTGKCITGDSSLVPEAEKLLDQLEIDCDVRSSRWTRSVSGAYPCVPDYLSGSPTPMRRRRRIENETAPVQIFVSTTCSAGIGHETMMKRGIVILALLMKLQQIRPVQLYLIAETDGRRDGFTLQRIRVESQPLNLSTACYALARVGFARQMSYSMARKLNRFQGGWPDGYKTSQYAATRSELLGITPEDIWIGSAESWDAMITQPVEWLQERLNQYMSQESYS